MEGSSAKKSVFGNFTHEDVSKVSLARQRDAQKPLLVFWMFVLFAIGLVSVGFTYIPILRSIMIMMIGFEEDYSWYLSNLLSFVCFLLLLLTMMDYFSVFVKDDPKHLLGGKLEEKSVKQEERKKGTVPVTPLTPKKMSTSTPTSAKGSTSLNSSAANLRSSFIMSPPIRSPLSFSNGIMDESKLDSFLAASPNNLSTASYTSSVNTSLTRPLAPYQTSYRASSALEDTGFKESEAAKALLQRLQIELSMHSEWPYRMRRWISVELVEKCVALAEELKHRQATVDRVARVEYDKAERRRKEEQQQQQQQNNSWGGGGGSWGGSWGTTAFTGNSENAWGDFSGSQGAEQKAREEARQRAEKIVQRKHDALQLYLDVTQDRSCKDYVLDRLKQLQDGGTLSAYEWNGGGKFKGKPWSQDSLPTDAQIILHLFCTKLNLLLMSQARESGMRVGLSPFSSRYVLITPQEPDPKNKDVLLWLQRRNPPHLKVVVRGEVWEVVPGSYNLFHALVLYVYAVAKEERGVIEMMSLQQAVPDLLKVVLERK